MEGAPQRRLAKVAFGADSQDVGNLLDTEERKSAAFESAGRRHEVGAKKRRNSDKLLPPAGG